MNNSIKYLNEKEVALLTALSVQTLRNWRFQRRGFPYVKIGRAVRYKLNDVEQFFEARKIEPEGD